MAGRALRCALLAVLAASVTADVSWPGCPCERVSNHGPCTRIITRLTPDNTPNLNVHLQNCNIREITTADFPYPNARWIDLSTNHIKRIDADTFKSLNSVLYLSLEHNKLCGKRISHKAFQDCSQLIGIGLSGNDMRNAPDDLVQGLDKLNELYLVDTSLFEVPSFVKRASNLTFLLLSNNQINLSDPYTFSSLTYLNILHLDHNSIGFLPENIFRPTKNIETLHLDNNAITYIPDNLLSSLTKLKHLRLQNNVIQYISQFVFRDCPRLEELDLSNNRITRLSENFLSPRLPKRFYFSGNPLECEYLIQLLNQVTERQVDYRKYDNSVQVCYKCLDVSFNSFVVKSSTPEVATGAIGQLNYTIVDYCREASATQCKCEHD